MKTYFTSLLAVLYSLFLVLSCTPREGATGNNEPTSDQPLPEEPVPYTSGERFYEIKSALVEYQGPNSKTTLYFDAWGDLEARYQEVAGVQSITIQRDGRLFFIPNAVELHGTVVDAPPRKTQASFDRLVEIHGSAEAARAKLAEHQITVAEKKEEILGFSCEVRTIPLKNARQKMWLYKGILLKKQTIRDGKVTQQEVATRFQPEIQVDPNVFEIPSNVKF